MTLVKTISLMIPEDLDRRAAEEAKRRGISKSELIRTAVAKELPTAAELSTADYLRTMAGVVSVPVEYESVDDVVYSREAIFGEE